MEYEIESQNASELETPEVTLDDLNGAAEKARQSGELSEEKPEAEVVDRQQESPEDNAEKSRLGRKVAEMERLFAQQGQQLNQVIGIIQAFAEQAQAQNQKTMESDPEYIPTETQEFVPFLEKKLEAIINQKMTKDQQSVHEFAKNYIGYIDELASDEDDPALAAEIKKLTTGPGETFNKKYSDNPIADAGKNYQKAKRQVMAAQVSGRNPLKGGKPDGPLGAAPGNTTKRDDKTVALSAAAKRAASAWGHSDKELQDMMKE